MVTHPFDFCLQDDNNGNALIFDQTNGDYFVWQAGNGGTRAVILPWIAQTPGALVPSDPHVSINRCVITLEQSSSDRRVHAQIDTCAHTGSASIQATSPKVKFTITDRNTRDNTCAVN